jgi:hypothetical protein
MQPTRLIMQINMSRCFFLFVLCWWLYWCADGLMTVLTCGWLCSVCVGWLICWWQFDVLMIVLTCLMWWLYWWLCCVDVLMIVLTCWWLCWCVDVLMTTYWCDDRVDDYVDVDVLMIVLTCWWLCWYVDVLMTTCWCDDRVDD